MRVRPHPHVRAAPPPAEGGGTVQLTTRTEADHPRLGRRRRPQRPAVGVAPSSTQRGGSLRPAVGVRGLRSGVCALRYSREHCGRSRPVARSPRCGVCSRHIVWQQHIVVGGGSQHRVDQAAQPVELRHEERLGCALGTTLRRAGNAPNSPTDTTRRSDRPWRRGSRHGVGGHPCSGGRVRQSGLHRSGAGLRSTEHGSGSSGGTTAEHGGRSAAQQL